MKCQLLILIMLAITAHAADEKQPPPPINCDSEYTMYTHPDQRCREKKTEEYKALMKQFLDKARSKANGRDINR
jgi:hypothetical protein